MEWAMLLGMMAVTFGIRYLPFALADRLRLNPWVERALSYAPMAVLSAIIAPAVLVPKGELWLDWRNPYLVAAVVAIIVAALTRNLLATIAAGMGLFALWRFWL
ncbi:AzlD domain-containing protein [Hahella sp. HN01]|uniref:AzlD domain-containing protein n=1 Tax=unclassified Hahella TaxID=2624107 RepID=UPI001C1EC365|nr:AzlD domain-containing protein [Hahella sp. HN01]MBU6951447.1 AzlD domain-containing protein [Hahella sp. HN01]